MGTSLLLSQAVCYVAVLCALCCALPQQGDEAKGSPWCTLPPQEMALQGGDIEGLVEQDATVTLLFLSERATLRKRAEIPTLMVAE